MSTYCQYLIYISDMGTTRDLPTPTLNTFRWIIYSVMRYLTVQSDNSNSTSLQSGGRAMLVAPTAQLVKGRLSDAGGLRFESQAGRGTGKSTPSLWRDRHPAIKGLRPPEHHAGKFHPDHKQAPSQTKRIKQNDWTNVPACVVFVSVPLSETGRWLLTGGTSSETLLWFRLILEISRFYLQAQIRNMGAGQRIIYIYILMWVM